MQRAKDLRSILDDTEKISKAVMLASTTMSMLNAMMQSQANQLPKRGSPQNEAYLSEFERCSQSGLDRTSHWPRRKEVPGDFLTQSSCMSPLRPRRGRHLAAPQLWPLRAARGAAYAGDRDARKQPGNCLGCCPFRGVAPRFFCLARCCRSRNHPHEFAHQQRLMRLYGWYMLVHSDARR